MTLLSESLDAADVTKLTRDGQIQTTRNKQQLISLNISRNSKSTKHTRNSIVFTASSQQNRNKFDKIRLLLEWSSNCSLLFKLGQFLPDSTTSLNKHMTQLSTQ